MNRRNARPGFLNQGPRATFGAMERFSVGHKQKPLPKSSVVILQNPIDEQGTTTLESLRRGATKHERLRNTVLEPPKQVVKVI